MAGASILKGVLDAHPTARVRASSTRMRLLDCSRVQWLVGWQPLCRVETGIRQTTDW